MKKKAQFYLFTMVILLALVTLLIISNRVRVKPDTKFDMYLENVDREAEYVINNALLAELEPYQELSSFFDNVADFGLDKRITLKYFYLIVNSTSLVFRNDLHSDVHLVGLNATIPIGGMYVSERDNLEEVAFRLDEGLPHLSNFIYKFYITEEDNQVMYLLFAKRGEQSDIYVRDNSP